jgi:hypothetical protein
MLVIAEACCCHALTLSAPVRLPVVQDHSLPPNVTATTSPREAITGAQFAIHAVPVQHTRAFLQGIKASNGTCSQPKSAPAVAALFQLPTLQSRNVALAHTSLSLSANI